MCYQKPHEKFSLLVSSAEPTKVNTGRLCFRWFLSFSCVVAISNQKKKKSQPTPHNCNKSHGIKKRPSWVQLAKDQQDSTCLHMAQTCFLFCSLKIIFKLVFISSSDPTIWLGFRQVSVLSGVANTITDIDRSATFMLTNNIKTSHSWSSLTSLLILCLRVCQTRYYRQFRSREYVPSRWTLVWELCRLLKKAK